MINGVRWAKFNVGEKGKFVSSSEKVGKYYALEEAKTSCPAGWRLPTKEEMQSLVKAGSTRTAVNGVSGHKFGNGNNSIFLPRGEDGYYITDALSKHTFGIDDDAYSYVIVLHYGTDYVDISTITLPSKMSVRCVCEQ
ncbi:MAG: fibrobacter succinogenes major paralogous domain-containing protein [Dysgonamonadaceae bacterium]|nr:fibrobacter succinogenes major paralogous domain-containing protein [Dysgonamonadaceae bacterium]